MNVFDLFAKISLDTSDYEKGLEKSKSKLENFGDGLKSVAGKIADVAKGATVAIGAAGTALTVLTKQTLDAVGSFEQLEGGAQKIFDEMDFEKISKDAKNAYKELNMSAAQYLEAINLAGATFAQTMGDEKGYDTARKGMLAIADYASGTGRNLEELNQKYQMITRATSSYQSIADQFSGILPATSADFLEQAQAAGYLADTYEKLTEVPVAEYQQALTNMLERGVKNLGLSNNTLRESTETLTGSFAMAKAAWQNFLTGQGTVGDFTGALTSAIEQTKKKLNVIIPRLTEGLTELVDEIAPFIPELVEDTLPAIITGASSLLTGLAERLPELIETIVPALADGVLKVVNGLWEILPKIGSVVVNLAKKSIGYIETNMGQIVGTLTSTVLKILEWISDPKKITGILQAAVRFVTSFVDALLSPQCLTKLLEAAPAIIGGIVQGITEALPALIEGAVQIVDAIVEWFTGADSEQHLISLLDAAVAILAALGKGMWDSLTIITDEVMNIAEKIADAFGFGDYWRAGRDAMEEFGRGMESKFQEVQQQAILFGSKIWEALHPAEALLERQEQMLYEQQHADFDHVFGGQEPSTPNNIAEYYQQQGTTEVNPFSDFIGAMTYTGEKKKTNIPNNLAEYYAQKYNAPSFSDAATLGSISGDNNVSITINTTSDRPEDIGYAAADAVDQTLAKLQAQKNRGYGYSH